MNRKLVFLGCLIFALAVLGCEQQNKKISSQPPRSEEIVREEMSNEVWDGTPPESEALPDFFGSEASWGAFPESMVGVWEAESSNISKWGIKFEPDGSIKKIIHTVAGPVNVPEGGVHAEREDDGSYYIFVLGPCEARYIPETRMVKVKIIVDYFIMKLPAGTVEGRFEDYFEGPVSEDGKTWKAEWLNFSWIVGAVAPEPDLIKADPIPLVFTKLDLTQIEQEDSEQ